MFSEKLWNKKPKSEKMEGLTEAMQKIRLLPGGLGDVSRVTVYCITIFSKLRGEINYCFL